MSTPAKLKDERIDLRVSRSVKSLLKDALLRVSRAADIIGARALLVHAKDDDARAFYSRYDFHPSPTDPYQLCLVMKDLKRLLK